MTRDEPLRYRPGRGDIIGFADGAEGRIIKIVPGEFLREPELYWVLTITEDGVTDERMVTFEDLGGQDAEQ